jgi:uncharacterized repeat protein (TIGR03803 family)
MLGKRYVGTLSVLTLVVFSALLLTAGLPAYAQTESVLYNLSGDPGAPPEQGVSGLTSDGAGNFYGTTAVGGAAGEGAVFEISPNGSGGWYETVLHSLCSLPNCTDGANPYSNVIFDGKGNLYGTAAYGGADNSGVVFELSPAGRSWNETVLYSFANDGDGAYPTNNLIMDRAGNLYGPSGGGVFELSPSGANWTERNIYSTEAGSVTMDASGNIFGTGVSTVFELSPNGNGGWNPTVLHTFTGHVGLTGTPQLDKAGNLYGVTYYGGPNRCGIYRCGRVFELKHGKNGKWAEKVLHSFTGTNGDGYFPDAGVVIDAAGNIWGTTQFGGKSNCGVVFELVPPVGKGSYKENIVWSFNDTDGCNSGASLLEDSAGNFYGTTEDGGSTGTGVVFELMP